MGEYGFYAGPIASTSLNGAASGEIVVTGGGEVQIQAALYTNGTAHLHFRCTRATGSAATTLATSEGFLTHGGAITLRLNPATTWYINWALFSSAGASISGGAADYVLEMIQRG